MGDIKDIIYNHINEGLEKNGNRSNKRTDKLHNDLLNIIKDNVDNFDDTYNVFFEKSIKDMYGGKFKIDIVIEDKDGNIKACILVKAFISSVGKNKYNYANTTVGEIARIRGMNGRESVKIWFISLLANEIPIYKKDGTLRGMEKTENSYIDFNKLNKSFRFIFSENNIDNTFHSTIKYDLLNINYSSKRLFRKSLNKENISITENKLVLDARKIL